MLLLVEPVLAAVEVRIMDYSGVRSNGACMKSHSSNIHCLSSLSQAVVVVVVDAEAEDVVVEVRTRAV